MNKNEFTDAIAEKAGLTKKDAKNVVEACIDIITENLVNNETITFLGFGSFTTVKRGSRKAPIIY